MRMTERRRPIPVGLRPKLQLVMLIAQCSLLIQHDPTARRSLGRDCDNATAATRKSDVDACDVDGGAVTAHKRPLASRWLRTGRQTYPTHGTSPRAGASLLVAPTLQRGVAQAHRVAPVR
eukprot:2978240-Prymnesium_polylepis.3